MAKNKLELIIAGDAKGAIRELSQLNDHMGKTGNKFALLGKAAMAAGAAIGAAMVGIGAFSLQSAMKLDEAYDTIRVGTGATGKDLDSLKESFKTVFKGVPADAQTVGTAIADLNTRTGQTGKGLEDLTKQVVNLATVTKTDVGAMVAATTRVFGDWSIATGKQSEAMDYLFKVSQQTGVGVGKLSETVVQFGAPLRQLGFDFETSAAMLGKFEKEGVNTETVLAGMKIGLANMAQAGKDGAEGMLEAITAIKEAGTQAEANTIAIEIFGKRAGPDMAAAVREGRFELDDLLKTLKDSPETINKASEATYDFGERWIMAKNKLTTIFEPLGIKLMDILDKLAVWVDKHMPEIEEAFDKTFTFIGDTATWIGEDIIPPLIKAFQRIRTWVDDNKAGIEAFWNDVKGAAKEFREFIEEMVPIVIQQVTKMKADVDPALKEFKKLFDNITSAVAAMLRPFGDGGEWSGLATVISAAWTVMWVPLKAMLDTFTLIAKAINTAIAAIKTLNSTNVQSKQVQTGMNTAYGGGQYKPATTSRGITRALGGPIPGSGPVPITAHGGEYVLTKGDTSLMQELIAAVKAGQTGGGTKNINIAVSGTSGLDLGRQIAATLATV